MALGKDKRVVALAIYSLRLTQLVDLINDPNFVLALQSAGSIGVQ